MRMSTKDKRYFSLSAIILHQDKYNLHRFALNPEALGGRGVVQPNLTTDIVVLAKEEMVYIRCHSRP